MYGELSIELLLLDVIVLLRFVEVLLRFCRAFVEVLLRFCWGLVEVLLRFCWGKVEVLIRFPWGIVEVFVVEIKVEVSLRFCCWLGHSEEAYILHIWDSKHKNISILNPKPHSYKIIDYFCNLRKILRKKLLLHAKL